MLHLPKYLKINLFLDFGKCSEAMEIMGDFIALLPPGTRDETTRNVNDGLPIRRSQSGEILNGKSYASRNPTGETSANASFLK